MATAGQRNQRIVVEQPPTGVDVLGQRTGSWTTQGNYWAQALPLRGLERATADASQSGAAVKFRLQHSNRAESITADMRITWKGRIYAILGDPIDVNGERTTIEIMCSSAVAP